METYPIFMFSITVLFLIVRAGSSELYPSAPESDVEGLLLVMVETRHYGVNVHYRWIAEFSEFM